MRGRRSDVATDALWPAVGGWRGLAGRWAAITAPARGGCLPAFPCHSHDRVKIFSASENDISWRKQICHCLLLLWRKDTTGSLGPWLCVIVAICVKGPQHIHQLNWSFLWVCAFVAMCACVCVHARPCGLWVFILFIWGKFLVRTPGESQWVFFRLKSTAH